jgi:hypothetical protein
VRIGLAHAAVATALTCALVAGAMPASAQIFPRALTKQPAPKPDDRTIADAYIYLLGRALVIRQEHTDLRQPGFAYNTIKYNTPGSADFVNPNLDVAYLEAWIAVDDSRPALLEIPEITGRYYTAQILDEWGEVIANINERTFPSKPFGKFALVAPGSRPWLPPDAARIELHSNKAKLLGRVELRDDRDGALKLQRQFKLASIGTPAIKSPPQIPMFDNNNLMGAAIFDDANAKLASASDVSPVAAEMQQKVRAVAAYTATNKDGRVGVEKLLREKVIPEFKSDALTKSAPYRNHWMVASDGGNYGANYRLRTAANYAGIWANTPREVIYAVATRDANEQPLNGSNYYVIHFPADKLPQSAVDAYWSVILVSVPDYRVVSNPLNRFNLNNYSPLKNEADGSLKIAIGPKPIPAIPESNWLPSAAGKPFSLTFRTYVPKDSVRTGAWTPPAVSQFGEARAIGITR